MRLFLTVAVVLFTCQGVSAQSGRQLRALYNLNGGSFESKGWHFAPGVTYCLPTSYGRFDQRLIANDAQGVPDTLYTGTFDDTGGIGFYLEVGRHHFIDYFLLTYLDYSLGYKQLRGGEQFAGRMLVDSAMVNVDNAGEFSQGRLVANFNLNNIWQITDNSFIQNSVGINADYRVSNRFEYQGPTTGMLQTQPGNFTADIHWKIGYGWRPENGVFIIPSIEAPILAMSPFDDGKATTQWFSTRYRPIIFSLRFLLFDRRSAQDCVGKSAGDKKYELFDNSRKEPTQELGVLAKFYQNASRSARV